MTARRLRPPSGGMAPPHTATLPDGTKLDLLPLARQISDAHLARHPDELERYGEAGREWCTHDNQHLLSWAALDLQGSVDFDEQLGWLSRVLSARGYPIANLADNLRTAGTLIRQHAAGAGIEALANRFALAAESLER
jgi:hypothetical protein